MSNAFVTIKMYYVYNQWYDISCAIMCFYQLPMRLLPIFPHYLLKGTIFWKKLLNTKRCVLIFSTILSELQIYYHKCTYVFLWSTCYCCQILFKVEFSRQIFEKNTQIWNCMTICVFPYGRRNVQTDVWRSLTLPFRIVRTHLKAKEVVLGVNDCWLSVEYQWMWVTYHLAKNMYNNRYCRHMMIVPVLNTESEWKIKCFHLDLRYVLADFHPHVLW